MRHAIRRLPVLFGGLLLAAPLAAADEMPGPGAPPEKPAPPPVSGKFFDAHDANLDGRVTREEFLSQKGDEEVFGLLDGNGDGVVTLEEVGLPPDYKPKPLPPPPPPGSDRAGDRRGGARRLQELMAMDADKDGRVSREEYKGRVAFDRLDADKDGFLSREDFQARARAETEARFKERDKDGDGKVARAEFPGTDDAFKALDRDGDGSITLAEMQAGPSGRGDRAPGKAPLRGDKNGDGKVTRDEFPGTDDAFKALDQDGDGAITAAELGKAGRPKKAGEPSDAMPPPPPGDTTPPSGGMGALFSALDRDGDGRLARNEFAGDDARWRSLDRNADGWVTPDEAR
jgi:Ca2+-binding EF-hand superfamily protein